ncbi:hypothetical protein AB0C84_40220 [Actinomadura sp. NPDC048955]|uniref:hypothetical protein n=1 Tax=Actinomadura sp. NPDC048955 TaxID=3158228 RepID=UPI0033E169E1
MDRRGFITSAFSLPLAVALPTHASAAPPPHRPVDAGRIGTVGHAEVTTVREVINAFTRADERLGGGSGRTAIAEYLATDATAYLQARPANSRVRAQMYGAVAEVARLCGWKAHDQGRDGLAQRYYLHAWQLAREADPAHGAFILRLMAHQAIDLEHGRHAVHIAESARAAARGRTDTTTLGQLHLAEARAHAAAGNARAARTALNNAERSINTHTTGADRPWWASAMGAPQPLLTTHTAKVLADLGDPAAERHLAAAVSRWDPDLYPRVRALNLCDLAGYHAKRGATEPACEAVIEALELLQGITSARARKAVAQCRGMLTPHRHRGGAALARTDALAAQWLNTAN